MARLRSSLTKKSRREGYALHPVSITFAVLAPAALLTVALILSLRCQELRLSGPLQVTVSLSSLPIFSRRFSDASVAFATLLHPQLRLAYLWLGDDRHSLLLTTDRTSVASVTAALSQRGIPNLTKHLTP